MKNEIYYMKFDFFETYNFNFSSGEISILSDVFQTINNIEVKC